MDKKTSYKILPELRLFLEYYSGPITLKELIGIKKKEITDKDYDPTFNAIGDLRDADFQVSVPDIVEYHDFVKNTPNVSGKRKTAMLTKTPSQVARSLLYQMESRDMPMSFRIVSVMASALEWVGLLPDYCEFIEETLRQMKKT